MVPPVARAYVVRQEPTCRIVNGAVSSCATVVRLPGTTVVPGDSRCLMGRGSTPASSEGSHSMFAVVRDVTLVPERYAAGRAAVEEFTTFFDRQPGCRGQLVVDAGEGRHLVLEVWESEAHYLASRETVGREADRLLRPMFAGEGRIVGSGAVEYDSTIERVAHA
jgi:quinol monooxygenase YgiN